MMGFAANLPLRFKNIILFAAVPCFLWSCTVVRDYPQNKPFVYESEIVLHGDLTSDQRKDLRSGLSEQLHDSVTVRSVQKLAGFDRGLKFFYSVIKKPPVYDSLHSERSLGYISALLHSLGYYRDSAHYVDTIIQRRDEQRAYLQFHVFPGKRFLVDSVRVNLNDSNMRREVNGLAPSLDTLQKITLAERGGSLLKRGEPFAKPLIGSEFDRLTDVYRNNGYLRFRRDELVAVWDTVGVALLRPTIDPLEQAELFEALQRRRENPVADIEIRLRSGRDSSYLKRFYVGNVTVYPDFSFDTTRGYSHRHLYKGLNIIEAERLFKHRVIAENIFLKRGELYDQRKQLRTINRFNAVGAWRLASIDPMPRGETDTVDFTIRLTPAEKYFFEYGLEISQNLGGLFVGNNLLSVNLNLLNRNFSRGANQSTTRVGFGQEINAGRLTKTQQVNVGHTIYFPRVLPNWQFRLFNWKILPDYMKENARTSLALSSRYVLRIDYLELLTVNTSWGYSFNWKNKLLTIRFPNVEYAFLKPGPDLDALILSNQSYKYIFNTGLVSSSIFGYTQAWSKRKFKQNDAEVNIAKSFRGNIEAAGLLLGIQRPENKRFDTALKRFVKLDLDYRFSRKVRRTEHAFRLFAGVGYSLRYDKFDTLRFYLPFFRSYFAGGANSMRGWTLRKLGPGSTITSFDRKSSPDRFGDMQLEFNYEFRFHVAEFNGINFNSTLFTDIGNIWSIRKNPIFPGGEFRPDKIGKDIAIAVGTGIRVDFGFINIRADFGYKAKDPSPANIIAQNKWFYKVKWYKPTLQIGVDYPF